MAQSEPAKSFLWPATEQPASTNQYATPFNELKEIGMNVDNDDGDDHR